MHSSRVTVLDLLSATAESGNIDLTFLFFLEDDVVSSETVKSNENRNVSSSKIQGYNKLQEQN